MNAFLILFSPYPHTRYSSSATEYLRKWMNDNSRDWVRAIVPVVRKKLSFNNLQDYCIPQFSETVGVHR